MYRVKYNLPPNDPRFLDLTDEEIVYDLVLQNEYQKWSQDIVEEETADNRVIYKNSDEFSDLAKKIENGEDIDLDAMLIPKDKWEKVDG